MTQPFSFNFGGFRCSAVNFQSRFASKANQSGLLPLFRTVVRGIGLALLCAVAAIGLTGCGSNQRDDHATRPYEGYSGLYRYSR